MNDIAPVRVERFELMKPEEQVGVLQASLYPGAKPDSVKAVIDYCRAAGLNPMLRPVHIVPMSVKRNGKWDMVDVIMPGVAHYRTQASRSGRYLGCSEPRFGPQVTARLGAKDVEYPEWCSITVYAMVAGQRAEFTATEYWLENYATKDRESKDPNAMWSKRPRGQLAKVAEAQALRKAFPELLGGQETYEEMEGKVLESPDALPAVEEKRLGKPTQTLDAMTARPEKEAAPTEEVEDAHFTEVADGAAPDLPAMPELDAQDWQEKGRWLAGWKWLEKTVPTLQPAAAGALLVEHRLLLRAVHSSKDDRAAKVEALLAHAGLTKEAIYAD